MLPWSHGTQGFGACAAPRTTEGCFSHLNPGGTPFIVTLTKPRRDNEQRGPVRAEELSRLYDAAAVHDLTYVWHDGLSGWTALHQSPLEYVAPQFAPSPGPPVSTPKMLALPPPPPQPGTGESVSGRASSSVDVNVGRRVSVEL